MNGKSKSPILYLVLRPIAVVLFWIMFRPKVLGKENIPSKGNVVIAGNHISGWDCFMVIAGTRRCIHFLAKKEIFSNGFLNRFFRAGGLIPVDRENGDKDALISAKEYLKKGAVVGIFPEGTAIKSDNYDLLPFKMGAIKMASDTDSPIVPFTVTGDYKFFGKSNLVIQFHPMYRLESKDLEREREILMNKVRSGIK